MESNQQSKNLQESISKAKEEKTDAEEQPIHLTAKPRTHSIPRSIPIVPEQTHNTSPPQRMARNYDTLVVTQINEKSSKERLKKIIQQTQKRRSLRLNWAAIV